MRIFETEGCNDAFVQLSQVLSDDAEYNVAPRGQATKEITNVVITIRNPLDRLVRHPTRNLSMRYLAGEFLWYERGSQSLAEIGHYSAFWKKCSDDDLTVRSSYGARLQGKHGQVNQWHAVRDELIRDPSSRRATLLILEPLDILDGRRDVPCTVGLQFLIRDNHLHLTVWMRSNDLFLGFCYDAAVFTLWQEKMLKTLRAEMPWLKIGTYTHIATSMHVYECNFAAIAEVAQKPDATRDCPLSQMPEIVDIEAISLVQPFENALRTEGRNKVALERFDDPFADWLARCLYEG